MAASDWNFCAIALGVLLATGYLGREGVPAPASPLLYGSIFATPLWALLQTIPLPVALVSVLSPERVALAKPLLRFGLMPGVLSLSIQPDASLQYAIRYLAFGAAFLIARDLMWRLPARPWLVALLEGNAARRCRVSVYRLRIRRVRFRRHALSPDRRDPNSRLRP